MMHDNIFYRITFSNGEQWDIPIGIIALRRAEYYADVDGVTIKESMENDTLPLFMDDFWEAEDFAKNNMTWDEVKQYAFKVKDGDINRNEEWFNCDVEQYDCFDKVADGKEKGQ